MLLAVKVDVDTYRGTLEGVPALARVLEKHHAGASFLFSLGRDHTGRAIKRAFRPGFMQKVQRTSVVEHYGVRTLLYGTLLPGPDIGRRCADIMRATDTGRFEAGIHCWDHVRWQDGVTHADAGWTERDMNLASNRFMEIFGKPSPTWGAAGWQTNRHAAFFQEQRYKYASDTRGTHPFLPLWDGVQIGCAQLPTTLPTMDEILGADGIDEQNVAEAMLERTRAPQDIHVFTAHAELEGGRLLKAFEWMLAGWHAQGYEVVSLGSLFDSLEAADLPKHEVLQGTVPGRSGTLAVQG